eukprot:TRINITY_DN5164_c0_g1_i2.p1 TRINITY_DN5164_c0_g1~~TRINITY_DN5164_c0_g1_i2.p1  ORF type:complete len:167 (+),score=26.27 TRINITY_DN5164_c0_g1_i2:860-1360(+)
MPFRTPPRSWWRRRSKKRAELEIATQPIECLLKYSNDPYCPIPDLASLTCLKTTIVRAGRILCSLESSKDHLQSMEMTVKLRSAVPDTTSTCRLHVQRCRECIFVYPRHRAIDRLIHQQNGPDEKSIVTLSLEQDEELFSLVSVLFSFLKFMQRQNLRFLPTETTP